MQSRNAHNLKKEKKMTETGYKSVIWAYFEIFEPNYSIILLKKKRDSVRLYTCLKTLNTIKIPDQSSSSNTIKVIVYKFCCF